MFLTHESYARDLDSWQNRFITIRLRRPVPAELGLELSERITSYTLLKYLLPSVLTNIDQ